jgi:hypothetical protein
MKEIKKKKIPPFFISMATAAKFVLPIPIFLAYLVPLDVDVTANITAKPFHKLVLEVKNGREKIFVINFYNSTSRVLLNGNHVHISEFVSNHLGDILQTSDHNKNFEQVNAKTIALNSSKAAAENVNTMFPFLYSKKTH